MSTTMLRRHVSRFLDRFRLPREALQEVRLDRRGHSGADPGPERVIDETTRWLARAQDDSATADGGFARHYSLLDGWGASYPETTGYIIPTLLSEAVRRDLPELENRGRRALDWLLDIQLDGGGFQGGMIGQTPVVPVVFNTGQILLGLAAGAERFGEPYAAAMGRAAEWLLSIQDADGAWRRGESPFRTPGAKSYYTHVAWGLLEAARVAGEDRWAEAALANIRWALTHQDESGWFSDCCLFMPEAPLTHTLGYALRGVLEGHRHTRDDALLGAALRTGRSLLGALDEKGRLPGRLDADWQPRVDYVCLTGSVQVAACWLLLHEHTGETAFLDGARRANSFVRGCVRLDGSDGARGGVKGSFPVTGAYNPYQYLNWSAKFLIDACVAETRAAAPRT